VGLPGAHFTGKRAATDILALASKGRAFRSLDTHLIRQGGPQVLSGGALALSATAPPGHKSPRPRSTDSSPRSCADQQMA
jgi:hypothetical protein